MPFPTLISAVVETALNHLLTLDRTHHLRMQPLLGKTIAVTLAEYKQPLYFHFSSTKIDVLNRYEGKCDVELGLALNTLAALKNTPNISELIKQDQLVIQGDIKVLQQFADLVTELDIDWAELLSHYTGDLVAHRATLGVKKTLSGLHHKSLESKQQLAEYLSQEKRLVLGQLEFVHFSDQVSELEQRTERLLQLTNSLGTH
ncbi:SCP2 domain-containing protein [Psychrobium sp. 1_MG-2023]|uniref:ubiquinone biosynthesis accessory factor UbiJ n=1 Tax=Psychrobium sp. 1_MG-2023 TaxID=3062624 RepID=UPI000C333FE8|nr:SCP2 sterol-binding domain-containing protein [Psychrobium sp. 1_MG-2023]MDP2561999.1 SCP2 sterol-binding domain-containing protein [Psychrobium sp. 1_MG-2023]PKF58619.1 hypothetical protein CW748_03020 [Alteromonadales bacterium alter-6D02]